MIYILKVVLLLQDKILEKSYSDRALVDLNIWAMSECTNLTPTYYS